MLETTVTKAGTEARQLGSWVDAAQGGKETPKTRTGVKAMAGAAGVATAQEQGLVAACDWLPAHQGDPPEECSAGLASTKPS